jgi:hypothetical protein
LAALVVVPLSVSFVARPNGARAAEMPVARRWLFLAAASLGGSMLAPSGSLAGVLVIPWLATCVWLAWIGLRRFLSRPRFQLEEIAIDVGLIHLPIGAAWAFAYRADMVVLGFTGTKALLTANHFHVGGLGACMIAGLTGRALPTAGMRRNVWRVVTVVIVLGILSLAIGITFSRPLERAVALALSLAVAVLGMLLFTLAGTMRRSWPLLVIAGLSALAAMARSAQFAFVGFGDLDDVWFRRMVLEHGLVNAVGFVVCGLVAFRISPRSDSVS